MKRKHKTRPLLQREHARRGRVLHGRLGRGALPGELRLLLGRAPRRVRGLGLGLARLLVGGGLAAPPSAARAARFAWPLRVAVAGPPPLLASSSRISRLTWGARPIGVFLRTMRSPSARAAKSRPLGERGAFGGGSIAAVVPPTCCPEPQLIIYNIETGRSTAVLVLAGTTVPALYRGTEV